MQHIKVESIQYSKTHLCYVLDIIIKVINKVHYYINVTNYQYYNLLISSNYIEDMYE